MDEFVKPASKQPLGLQQQQASAQGAATGSVRKAANARASIRPSPQTTPSKQQQSSQKYSILPASSQRGGENAPPTASNNSRDSIRRGSISTKATLTSPTSAVKAARSLVLTSPASTGAPTTRNGTASGEQSIRVIIRPRLDATSTEQGVTVSAPDATIFVHTNKEPKEFTYDVTLPTTASQSDVYEQCGGASLLQEVCNGYNAGILLYGQTGSGKTHTAGIDVKSQRTEEMMGLAPRLIRNLLQSLAAKNAEDNEHNIQYKLCMSYIEIYTEQCYDLLTDTTQRLEIGLNSELQYHAKNMLETEIVSAEQAMKLLQRGFKHRTTAATNSNAVSSRSHALLHLIVKQSSHSMDGMGVEVQQERVSRLVLADLAGSESAEATEGRGKEAQTEGSSINLSLSTLRRVFECITSPNGQLPPFNDSSLTRLLRPCIGGDSKSIFIACIHAGSEAKYQNQTYTTLRYAHMVKAIKNKPRQMLTVRSLEKAEAENTAFRRYVNDLLTAVLKQTPELLKSPLTSPNPMMSKLAPPISATKPQALFAADDEQGSGEQENMTPKATASNGMTSPQTTAKSKSTHYKYVMFSPELAKKMDKLEKGLTTNLTTLYQPINTSTEDSSYLRQQIEQQNLYVEKLRTELSSTKTQLSELSTNLTQVTEDSAREVEWSKQQCEQVMVELEQQLQREQLHLQQQLQMFVTQHQQASQQWQAEQNDFVQQLQHSDHAVQELRQQQLELLMIKAVEHEEYKTVVERLNAELRQLNDDKEGLQHVVEERDEQAAELNAIIHEQSGVCQDLKQSLVDTNALVAARDQQVVQLQQQLDEQTAARSAAQSSLTEATTTISSQQQQISDLKQQLQASQGECLDIASKFSQEQQATIQQYEQYQIQIGQLQAGARDAAVGYEGQIEELQRAVLQWKSQLQQSQEQCEELQHSAAQQQHAMETLHRQVASLQQQLHHSDSAHDGYMHRIQQLQRVIQTNAETQMEEQHQHRVMQTELRSQLNAKNTKLMQTFVQLTASAASLHKTRAQAVRQQQQHDAARMELRSQLILKNNKLMQMFAQLTATTASLRHKQRVATTQQTQLTSLQAETRSQMAAKNAKLMQLFVQLAASAANLRNTQHVVASQQHQINALNAQITEQRSKLTDKNTSLMQLFAQLAASTASLQKTQEAAASNQRQQDAMKAELRSQLSAKNARLMQLYFQMTTTTARQRTSQHAVMVQKQQISTLQSDLQQAQQQCIAVSIAQKLTKEKLTTSVTECQSVQQTLMLQQVMYQKLEAKTSMELADLQQQHTELTAQSESTADELKTTTASLVTVQQELASRTNEHTTLSATHHSTLQQHKKLDLQYQELMQTTTQLDTQLLSLQHQSVELVHELKASKQQVATLQLEKHALEVQNGNVQLQLGAVNRQAESYQATIERLEAEINAATQLKNELDERLLALATSASETATQLQQEQQRALGLDSQVLASQIAAERLSNTLNDKDYYITSLHHQKQEIDQQLQALQSQHSVTTNHKQKTHQIAENLANELKLTKKEQREVQEKLAQKQAECDGLQAQVQQLQSQVTQGAHDAQLLQAEHAKEIELLQAQVSTAQTELADVRYEVAALKDQTTDLQQQLADKAQTITHLQNTNAAYSAELHDQRVDISQHKQLYHTLQQQCTTLEQQCQALHVDLLKSHEDSIDLHNSMEELTSSHTANTDELQQQLQQQLSEHEQALNVKTSEIDMLKRSLHRLETEKLDVHAQLQKQVQHVSDLTASYTEKLEATDSELQQQLRAAKLQNKAAAVQIQDLQQQMLQDTTDLDNLTDVQQLLEMDVEQLQGEKKDLQATVSTIEQRLRQANEAETQLRAKCESVQRSKDEYKRKCSSLQKEHDALRTVFTTLSEQVQQLVEAQAPAAVPSYSDFMYGQHATSKPTASAAGLTTSRLSLPMHERDVSSSSTSVSSASQRRGSVSTAATSAVIRSSLPPATRLPNFNVNPAAAAYRANEGYGCNVM